MFNWLKNILSVGPSVPAVTEAVFGEKKVDTKVTKVTKASLSKLTKQGLEDFAKSNYSVDIDKRKKKDDLVKEVLALSKNAK